MTIENGTSARPIWESRRASEIAH